MKNIRFLLKKQLHHFSLTNTKTNFITLSQSAKSRLREIMSQRSSQNLIGVKISLSKKGCNGLAYNMDYIKQEQIRKFDEIIQAEGLKVIIDSKAIMAVIGTEMDYVESQIGSQFVFNNPNQKGKCGCGTSFHL